MLLLPHHLQHLLPDQRLLEDPRTIASVLRFVPDQEVVDSLTSKWAAAAASSSGSGSNSSENGTLSIRRWHQLSEAVEQKVSQNRKWIW
jgi:hypothetical protein